MATVPAAENEVDLYAEYGFTSEQISNFRETFVLFDTDGDGTVSTKELAQMFVKMGINLTEEGLKEIMRAVDTDHTGTMSLKDFCAFMAKTGMVPKDPKAELRAVFNRFDLDLNNRIQPDELRNVMLELGEKMSAEDVDKIFMEAHCGEEGMTFKDFKDLMRGVI